MKKPVIADTLTSLTDQQNAIRTEFVNLLQEIKRSGMSELMAYLDGSDFYYAPASTKFHGSYDGGLAYHSLLVCEAALSLFDDFYPKLFDQDKWLEIYPRESVILTSLLHDLCKIDTYVPGFKNQKDEETGKWEKVATYTRTPAFPMGHGGKSVFLIQRYLPLNDLEAQAIFWHMGGHDISPYQTQDEMGKAFDTNFLAFLLHQADMMTSYVLENERYFDPQ